MPSATQLSLLDAPATGLPDEDEAELIEAFRALDFKPFEFHGYFGNRRTVSFGWPYDFASSRVRPASEMPDFLLPLRDRAGAFARTTPDAFQHAPIPAGAPGAA